jgi:raffinose/stachyose/melibiose transport system permease protein
MINRLGLRSKRGRGTFLNYLVLSLMVLFALGPIYVLVSNSLKTRLEMGENPLGIPSQFLWQNYAQAWVQGGFGRTMLNSLFLVIVTVTGVLFLGGMAAYSLARFQPRGSGVYMSYMLALTTIPIWLYVIPLFILWRELDLLNSLWGLALIYIALQAPFAIFLLRSYLIAIPGDFEDAARVDGANEWQILTKVVVPMVWPGFLTAGLVVALAVWSEFQVALIFLFEDELMPVTTSYFKFQERFGQDLTLSSAAAVMMILPALLLFLFMQRRFVEGLTQGGIK